MEGNATGEIRDWPKGKEKMRILIHKIYNPVHAAGGGANLSYFTARRIVFVSKEDLNWCLVMKL